MAEVRGEWASPIFRSAGQPARSDSLSFHCDELLASCSVQAKPAWSRQVGKNETARPALASSGSHLSSLSLAPSARHHLRQEPDAGNPPARICAGGTEKSVSLPRHSLLPLRSSVPAHGTPIRHWRASCNGSLGDFGRVLLLSTEIEDHATCRCGL